MLNLTLRQVTWDSLADQSNPRNWSIARRWAAAVAVSLFSFIAPMSSSMIAPALPQISSDLHMPGDFMSQLSLSVFVLAFAVGPLFLGPLSEIYGRVIVLQASNLFYLVFNTACGLCQSQTQLIVFRFLAGVGGSAPLAVWLFPYPLSKR
jgi:MFS family permease